MDIRPAKGAHAKTAQQARAKGGIDPAAISQLEERVNGAEQAWRQAAPEYLTVYQAADFRRLTSMKEVCTSSSTLLLCRAPVRNG